MRARRAMFPASVLAAGAIVAALAAPAAQGAPSSTGVAYMNVRVCGTPALGNAACDAIRHVTTSPAKGHGGHGPGSGSITPVSYDAHELQTAYDLSGPSATDGTGKTVAVVDAYNDPNAYGDLNTYRTNTLGGGTSGTRLTQCSVTASGTPTIPLAAQQGSSGPCFAKVNESGQEGPYPTDNKSWAQEISLDLDVVSAICPNCNILLVEATSANLTDLGTAVNTAASFSPAAIGNSYGAGEFSTEATYASQYYDHSGIAITAATGDSGYGVDFPAAASTVIAVGGTSLPTDSAASQTVWSGTGSGCSAYIKKPKWQTDTGCSNRTVADIAADADPNTGVNVYDSYGSSGWLVFGGTSVSNQIIAAVYGLAGGLPALAPNEPSTGAQSLYTGYTFGSPLPTSYSLSDVTKGSNGSCTGHGRNQDLSLAYLCTARAGYDGPTGMGTPLNSLADF